MLLNDIFGGFAWDPIVKNNSSSMFHWEDMQSFGWGSSQNGQALVNIRFCQSSGVNVLERASLQIS